MNILIVNDDGPDAYGLGVLRRGARGAFKESKIVTLTSERALLGASMGISPTRSPEEMDEEKLEKDFYKYRAKPADLIYTAFLNSERYLPPGRTWDAVLSGVNHGHNVGLDLLHSGTVGAVLIASAAFGCSAHAFSQEMDTLSPGEENEDRPKFKTAEALMHQYFQSTAFVPGECYNVNFPAGEPRGWKTVHHAHYSRWREIPTTIVPRAKGEISDITELGKGFVTITEVALRLNISMRY